MGNDKIPIPKFKLVYKDLFSFKALYKHTHEWLLEASFQDVRGNSDGAVFEQYYIHKESGGVYEILLYWKAIKKFRNTNLVYNMDINWQLIAGRQDERVINGKKVKGETGELVIEISSFVDVKNAQWDENPLLARLKGKAFARDYREQAKSAKSYFYSNANGLYTFMKQYLETKGAFSDQDSLMHQSFEDV